MMIFLSLRVTADAEGGLKIRAQSRPDLQGFRGGGHQQARAGIYWRIACHNGDTPKNGGDNRPMRQPTPQLQWEGTGLTRHCLSYPRLFWQTVSRPSHCGVRFAQIEKRTTPHTRVTKQAEAVGIDVSKGSSTVAVRRPGGEVVLTPFQVEHDATGLSGLIRTLRNIGGDIRVVMEHTGMYWRPIALALKEAGFFVSVVNAMRSSMISAATPCATTHRRTRPARC